MSFIEISDLQRSIDENEIEQMIIDNTDLATNGIDTAIGETRSILYNSFDVDVIFAKTGTARSSMLITVIVDIAIYRMIAACGAAQHYEDRLDRYKAAITWLKDCRSGKNYPDLERREEGNIETKAAIVLGKGISKRTNYL